MKIIPRLYISGWLLLCNLSPVFSQPLPNDLLAGIHLGIDENYDAALVLFQTLAKQNPGDPAPHLLQATIWQTRMMDFETQTWRDDFLREIHQTLELSDSLLQHDPQNIPLQFYYASALAYKSFQISREGKYLSGLRLAFSAVDRLEKIVARDSTFYDAWLGIGSYLYWRSYLTRNFAWLPFFHDQREKGLAYIRKSCEKGALSRWAALSNLAWIYIQEERYAEAVACAQEGLAVFPHSRFFLWPLGDAQFKMKAFADALTTYAAILQSVTAEEFNNHYNETVLHLKIARCYFELGDLKSAHIHAQKVLEIEPAEEVRERLVDKRKQAAILLAKINAAGE